MGMDDLMIELDKAENILTGLLSEDAEWQLCKETSDATVKRLYCSETGCNVFRLDAVLHGHGHGHGHGHEYGDKTKGTVTLMHRLCHRLHVMGKLRVQWDSQLKTLQILDRVNESTFLVRHVTKSRLMGLISERDSIDLCHFNTDPLSGIRRVTLTGIINRDHHIPIGSSNIVRVHTFPTALIFRPMNNSMDSIQLTGLLHCDMKLPVLPMSIREAFIPGGMLNFFADLKDSLKTNGDNEEEWGCDLPGWL